MVYDKYNFKFSALKIKELMCFHPKEKKKKIIKSKILSKKRIF